MIARRECLLLVLLLAACAHRPESAACVSPAAGMGYCLLPPAAISSDRRPRLVRVVAPDVDRYLVSQLGVENDQLMLAASSLLGQPLFEIRYGAAHIETVPADAPVRAAWLLAMLQFANADVAAVNSRLDGARMTVDDGVREIRRGNRLLASIARTAGNVRISLPEQEMTIEITELNSDKK